MVIFRHGFRRRIFFRRRRPMRVPFRRSLPVFRRRRTIRKRSSRLRARGRSGYGRRLVRGHSVPIKIFPDFQRSFSGTTFKADQLNTTTITWNTLFKNPLFKEYTGLYSQFRVRGIGLKFYDRSGPHWGQSNLDTDDAWKSNPDRTINNWGYLVFNSYNQVKRFTSDADGLVATNLKKFEDLLCVNNFTHRLTYWDKPLRIFSKWPIWTSEISSDNTKGSHEIPDYPTNPYRWFNVDEFAKKETQVTDPVIWFGPAFIFGSPLPNRLAFDYQVYIEFRGIKMPDVPL